MTEEHKPTTGAVAWNTVEGSGGKGGSKFQEHPNTLKSRGIARILDLISEGEIRGLVDGSKSIFLDDTPIENADGELNFNGVSWAAVYGLPDQGHIPGFSKTETPVAGFSSLDLLYGVGNVRRIADLNADAAMVTLQVPALNQADEKKLAGTSVSMRIEVKERADQLDAVWRNAIYATITGKTTSPYEEDYRIDLPGTGPWDIRVTRLTADSTDVKLVNETKWARLQIVYDHKFSYPFSALIGLEVNAEYFGTTIPRRGYEVYGLIIQVPTNYDPITRAYTGQWNGTFKWAWTNNPAWVFYDLLTNTRYGLGLASGYVDKWSLYSIAQYCDGLYARPAGTTDNYHATTGRHGVSDGKGGFEPRFTFNGILNKSEDAYKVLQALASSFRGMVYWGAGMVTATQDRPDDATKLFTPANVIGGDFEYAGSSKKARHTVAIVAWNNPDMGYEIDYEVVEDREAIVRYGMRPTDVTAFGCTSQSQARRIGRWILATERLETDSVKFKAGFDAADLTPGALILVSDPAYAGVRMGGRITNVSASALTIDAPFNFQTGEQYTISLMSESGQVATAMVSNAPGLSSIVQLVAPLANEDLPQLGAIYTLTEVGKVLPRPFRVLSVAEAEPHQFEVFAIENQVAKYDIADTGATFDDAESNQFQNLPNPARVSPPSGLSLQMNAGQVGGGTSGYIYADWHSSSDPLLQGYMVSYRRGSDNWENLPMVTNSSAEIPNADPGNYEVRVFAVNRFGVPSAVIAGTLNVANFADANGKDVIDNLRTTYGGTTFTGPDVTFRWDARPLSSPSSPAGDNYRDQFFDGFRVRVMNGATVLRTEYVDTNSYSYDLAKNQIDGSGRNVTIKVSMKSVDGSFSSEVTLTATNPAPVAPTVTVTTGPGAISMRFTEPLDADYGGIVVYASTTSGFTPSDANKVWEGYGQPDIPLAAGTTQYIRWAFYDAFGKAGLTPTAQITRTIPYVNSTDLNPALAVDVTTAVNAATNASNSAAAAASSQATAATNASNAITQASNAATSASSAATQASNALTQATNAATSATNAASSYSAARLAAAATLPDDFSQNGEVWFNGFSGAPSAQTPLAAGGVFSFPTVSGVGKVVQIATGGTNRDVGAIGAMAFLPNRTYRITVQGRVLPTVVGSPTFELYFCGLDATYAAVTTPGTGTGTLVANTWTTLTLTRTSAEILALNANVAFLRPLARAVGASGSNTFQFRSVLLEDITESAAAAGSATAAAGSASSASTSATNAGNSATAANASSVSAASSFTAANLLAAMQLPDRYDGSAGSFFSTSTVGNPATRPDMPSNATAVGFGPVREDTTAANALVAPRGVVPAIPGRIYRIEAEFQRTALAGTANAATCGRIELRAMDSSYTDVAGSGANLVSSPFTGAVQTASALISNVASAGVTAWPANTVWLRPYYRAYAGSATSITTQFRRLTITDVTEQQAALSSANAASTSASAAATSATNAGTSASAANTSATNASTSAGQAGTSATNAANSATTATTQANNASTSASTAATHATNAGNSASAAGTSATTAGTHATNAGNSATAANTSAVNAASSYASVIQVTRNGNFDQGRAGWTDYGLTTYVASTAGRSNVLRTNAGIGSTITSTDFYPVQAGANYRVSIGFRVATGTGVQFYAGLTYYDAAGNLLSAADGTGNYPLIVAELFSSASWVNRSVLVGPGAPASPHGGTVTFPANTAFMKPIFYYNYNNVAGAQCDLDHFTIETATAEVGALASASAAATSASSAATSATNAGTSASAAATSATNASTSAGSAGTSATNAANSATTATTQANNAATSASTAATHATNAGNSASAAGTSATTAGTHATNAGNSATAANTSAVNAASSYTNTVVSGGNQDFSDGLVGWSWNTDRTIPTTNYSPGWLSHQASFQGRPNVVRQTTGNYCYVYSNRLWPVQAGRTYRVRSSVWIGAVAPTLTYVGMRALDSTGAAVTGNGGHIYNVAGGVQLAANQWHDLVSTPFTTTTYAASGIANIQLLAFLNYGVTAGAESALDGIWLEDITESVAAGNSATAAATSASSASTSATNAGNSATTATTQANNAASSYNSARDRVASVFPEVISADTFTGGWTGNPTSVSNITVTNDASFGPVWQSGAAAVLGTRGVVQALAGRVYEVRAVLHWATVPGGQVPTAAIGVRSLDAAYANIGGAEAPSGSTGYSTGTNGTVVTLTRRFGSTAPSGGTGWNSPGTAIWLRPYITLNGSTTSTARVRSLTIVDVTSQVAAEGSASAAATSATNASTSATNAGTSATAASASAVSAASSFTNTVLVGGNQFFDDGATGWSYPSGNVTVTSKGGRANVFHSTVAATMIGLKRFPFNPARKYKITIGYWTGAGGSGSQVYAGFVAYDGNGAQLTHTPGSYAYVAVAGTVQAPNAGWVEYTSPVITPQGPGFGFPPGTASIALMALPNYNNSATDWGIDFIRLDDVTEAEAAASSATAASTSASSASTSATNAGASATAANSSATTAATNAGSAGTSATNAATSATNAASSATTAGTHATNAGNSATTAATQATNASNSAASAASSATLAASVSVQSYATNPRFSSYPSTPGLPTGWGSWVNGAASVRVAGETGGFGVTIVGGAGLDCGIVQTTPAGSISQNQYYVIEADVKLNSGALTGAGVLTYVADAAGSAVQTDLMLTFSNTPDSTGTAPGAGVVGQTYRFRKLVRATHASTSRLILYAMSHWSSHGSIAAANSLTWYMCSARPATPAEISAGVALPALQASVTTTQTAVANLETQNALARFEVSAATGGGTARMRLVSTTYGTNILLDADKIFFGDNTVFDNAVDVLVTTTGSVSRIIAWGAAFGTEGVLTEWEGPSSVTWGNHSRANATYYRANVAPFVGGSALPSSYGVAASHVARVGTRVGAGSVTTGTVTLTPVNPTGAVTYQWTRTYGDSSITATAATSATTAFTGSVSSGQEKQAMFAWTATDAAGNVRTGTVGVALIGNA